MSETWLRAWAKFLTCVCVCSCVYASFVARTYFIVLAFVANQQHTKKKMENGNNTPHQLVNISCFCFVNAHKIYYPFFCHFCRCVVHKLIILWGEICIYNWSTRRMTKTSSPTTTAHKTSREVNYFHWRNKHRNRGKNVLCDKQVDGKYKKKKTEIERESKGKCEPIQNRVHEMFE